jgi:hypothetical protein
MIVDVGDQLRPYLAVAVADLVKQLRRNGQPVPAELAALAAALWPERDRHAEPDPAASRRQLAAARSRRWRARQRGEDVPVRRPGPQIDRHEVA